MPPRYAYWTIIVDNQPTAFRSGSQEELMPTFKRLKAKNDPAVMMWWQHGKLWSSRVEAQEAMIAGREIGRRADERQPARRSLGEGGMGTGFRNRDSKPSSPQAFKPSSPQALKPSSPQALKPSSPQALKPSSPQAPKPPRPMF